MELDKYFAFEIFETKQNLVKTCMHGNVEICATVFTNVNSGTCMLFIFFFSKLKLYIFEVKLAVQMEKMHLRAPH